MRYSHYGEFANHPHTFDCTEEMAYLAAVLSDCRLPIGSYDSATLRIMPTSSMRSRPG